MISGVYSCDMSPSSGVPHVIPAGAAEWTARVSIPTVFFISCLVFFFTKHQKYGRVFAVVLVRSVLAGPGIIHIIQMTQHLFKNSSTKKYSTISRVVSLTKLNPDKNFAQKLSGETF